MINPSLYEQDFIEGFEFAKDMYGDEETALIFFQKFIDLTYIADEEDRLNKSVSSFQKKDWHGLREHVHTIKGRLK